MMRKALIQFAGLLFFTGMILAGSDGAWFPWLNLLSIPVSGSGAYLLIKTDPDKLRPAPRRD
ncbi:MAG: hypothetical protein K9J79_03700 [Desulfobacteraceae bacterium]|nr:hypothetical protein [Desulfobacteraceae bacterium]